MSTVRAGHGRMVHSMSYYPAQTHQRSSFDRSHSVITAFDGGMLIPIWWRYGYPGDTLTISTKTLTRLSAQIVPFMTNLLMDLHFWKVPIRLIWPHWLNMQGQQDNPGDSTDYLVPTITSGSEGFDFGSIFDHFDFVPGVAGYSATCLPLRAYNFVWNEWYRDENLQERVPQETGDTDLASNYKLLPRGKRKDYFTGQLPWPQKGEDVLLPIGTQIPVVGNGMTLGLTNGTGLGGLSVFTADNHQQLNGSYSAIGTSFGSSTANNYAFASNTTVGVSTDPEKSGLIALANETSATMSQLYMANAVQQILQVDARSGTRYIELILGRWGVRSTDSRLQRPEFLGGATFDLNTSIVPQTSSTDNVSPQGNLAAFSTITGKSNRIVTSFEEHCVVFAVASVRPGEYYYQQGLHRDFTKRSRFDFYEPGLANLPEQTVLRGEIYVQGDDVMDSDDPTTPSNKVIMGYQERFSEDKTAYSRIHGYMRSTAPQSLDIWHLGVKYNNVPVLNDEFIVEDLDPLKRVLAVNSINLEENNTPQFISNFYFEEHWIKEMPLFSNPSLMKF